MCEGCDWEEFVDEIDEYLEEPDFEWAEDTLSGIKETVEEMEHCTERQREAIQNLVSAVDRKRYGG